MDDNSDKIYDDKIVKTSAHIISFQLSAGIWYSITVIIRLGH